jgi:hypothetical protein
MKCKTQMKQRRIFACSVSAVALFVSLQCKGFGDFWDKPREKNQDETISALPDITPPTTPGSPVANPGGSSQINLSWSAASDNVTTPGSLVYEICQSTTPGVCNVFAVTFTSAAGATTYSPTSLSALTTYYYRIRARDATGNTGTETAEISATTSATGTVNTPTFSPVAGTFSSAPNITISSATVGATICYTTTATTPVCDATPSCIGGSLLYTAPFILPTTATIEAIACKNGETDSSVATGLFTIDMAPVAGSAISFAGVTATTLSVNWGAATDDITTPASLEYKVVKDDAAAANIDTIAEADAKSGGDLLQDWTANITTKAITGLTGSTTYFFAVLVRDAVGNKTLYAPATQTTSSPAGSNWTTQTLSASANWRSATFGNGMFVAVADGGTNATSSPDGITWTQRLLPTSATWSSVTYGNSLFVAVAKGPSTAAAVSSNGTTWTAATLPQSLNWSSVAYGNGLFVAVALGPTAVAATSPDGITWTQRAMPASATWRSIAYGNSVFVAITNGLPAATSADGITWTAQTMAGVAEFILFANGIFVTVPYGGANAQTSSDGISWALHALPSSGTWKSVAYGNGTFVAVADIGANGARSTDGINWVTQALPQTSLTSITYGNGLFVALKYASAAAITAP